MACHPEQPFTTEQEARVREIVREERDATRASDAAAHRQIIVDMARRRLPTFGAVGDQDSSL